MSERLPRAGAPLLPLLLASRLLPLLQQHQLQIRFQQWRWPSPQTATQGDPGDTPALALQVSLVGWR